MSEPPAAERRRQTIAGAIFSLMSARGAGLALRILASLIAARIAGPEAVGFVAWMGIFSIYVIWLAGGVTNGAERLIPIRRAQSELSDVQAMWGVTLLVNLLATATCLLLGAAAWLYFLAGQDNLLAWKVLGAGILCGITMLASYASAVFTADNRLEYLGRRFFLEGVLWWVFLPLAWLGAAGLAVRTMLVNLLPTAWCLLRSKASYRPSWNGRVALLLARDGLPILFSSFLMLLLFGLDRTLIAIFMHDLALGHYVLATSVISVMRMVQFSVSRVLMPSLGELFGRTRSAHAVAVAALQALPPLLVILLPCAVAGWFAMEPLTRWLLPDYLPGVPAGRIALISGALISTLGTNVFYVTIGRKKSLIAMWLAGLAVQALVSIMLYRLHGALESFAWGFVAGSLTSALLVNGGILYYIFRPTPSGNEERDGARG